MSISIEFLELSKTVTKIEFEILVQYGSEIKNVHLYLDGKIIKSWEKGVELTYKMDKPLLEGEHMYSVMAEDVSGNVASTSIKQFYVEKHEVQTGSIFGEVEYNNESLNHVKIDLLQKDTIVDSQYTLNNGTYYFDDLDFGNYYIEIRLIDEKNRFKIFNENENSNVIIHEPKIITISANNSEQKHDPLISNFYDVSASLVYINLMKAIIIYENQLEVKFDDDLLKINMFGTGTKSFYQPKGKINTFGYVTTPYISIPFHDSSVDFTDAPKNREWHEISHYVMDKIYGEESIPEKHGNQKFCKDIDKLTDYEFNTKYPKLDCNHSGIRNHDSSDSWIEGFATFMSLVIADKLKEENPNIYPSSHNFDVESIKHISNESETRREITPYMGLDTEAFAVAGILWDIYDDESMYEPTIGDDDDISLDIKTIFSLISQSSEFPKYYDEDGNCLYDENITESRHINYIPNLRDILITKNPSYAHVIDEIFSSHGFEKGIINTSKECRW